MDDVIMISQGKNPSHSKPINSNKHK
jgi:hypothetical protein